MMYFWQYKKKDKCYMQFKFDSLQVEVSYFENERLWVTIGQNHCVRGWKAVGYPEKTLIEQFSLLTHKDKITGISEVISL